MLAARKQLLAWQAYQIEKSRAALHPSDRHRRIAPA
jgi:hypothetical protein